jgi:hypothetical protein
VSRKKKVTSNRIARSDIIPAVTVDEEETTNTLYPRVHMQ